MATQPHEGRAILTEKINDQLGSFVNSTEIAIRNNLPNRNILAETTLKGLLNRIHGWDLVNANSIRQNYPGIDLIDTGRRIGVQVTSTNTAEKVKHTLEQVAKLSPEDQVDQLYILTITKDAPTEAMKKRTLGTCFSGEKHIWNIPQLLRQMMDLEVSTLEDIHAYLDTELGTLHQKMEQPHLVLRPVSAIGSGFVGREGELAEIQQRIDAGEKLIVLSGLGGMGKTELAVRFVQDYEDGAVYFIQFEDSFTHTVAKMANGIRPVLTKDELSRSDEELCESVLKILENCGDRDILIIDNVDSDQKRMSDLKKDPVYRKLTDLDLRLLLTTRFEWGQSVGIDRMDDDTLYTIFEKHEASISREEMKALIDVVNGHTLTIDLIARTLADNWEPVTAEEMLTALENSTLAEEDFAEVETYYNQSPEQVQIYQHLRTVFKVAKIPEAEQNILRCATLLPQTGMYFALFRDSLPEEWRKSLAPLGRRGWLTKEGDILTIHPVIRLVCQEELKPGEETCGAFLNALWRQFDPVKHERVKFAQMAEVFANAMEIDGRPETKADWLNNSGRLLGDLMESRKAATLYERYIPELEQKIPTHPTLATAYNNVGSTYGDLGDHSKALEYKLIALAIHKKVLPPDHPDLATSHNNVGITYGALGEHIKALEYLLKALAIWEKVLPADHPDLATSYNNVGYTYGDLGDHSKALEYKLKALAIHKKVLPPDHPDLATSHNNVGITYGALGEHIKALEYLLKALAIREKVLPPEHPSLATSYNNVSCTYSELGDTEKDLEYGLKALAILKKVLPPEHPDLATAYNNVGSTYGALGDHSKALEYKLKALTIREKVLPPEHPHLASSYNNVSCTYSELGDTEKDLEYGLKALAIREKVLPPDHPDLADSYHNVGCTYRDLRDDLKALELYEIALAIREKKLPAGHPDTESTKRNIANIKQRLAEKETAAP